MAGVAMHDGWARWHCARQGKRDASYRQLRLGQSGVEG
jgi:hypothetical protein